MQAALGWLGRRGTKKNVDGMARYGIVAERVMGVSVSDLKQYSKKLGRDHDLALALWDTGVYEARMLAGFVDDPALVTPAQMDRWAKDFDNWAVCDHSCFHLFDRTPHAWKKVAQWSGKKPEFVRRAAFALLAGLGRRPRWRWRSAWHSRATRRRAGSGRTSCATCRADYFSTNR